MRFRIVEAALSLALISLHSAMSSALTLPLQGKIHHVSPETNLQQMIDAVPAGDTIFFDAGEYDIRQTITLKSGQLYHGVQGTVLKGATPIFAIRPKDSHDIGIDGFTFEGGTCHIRLAGADALPGHADRISLVNNTFRDMDSIEKAEHADRSSVEMSFVKNSLIDHNVFTDLHGGGAIMAYHSDNTEVTFNVFNSLYEAVSMKFDGVPGTGRNITVSYNVCTGIDRMCIELQTGDARKYVGIPWTRNVLVEGNWSDNWSSTHDPNKIAYSVPLDRGSGTVVRYNYARFGGKGVGGFGIELGGVGAQSYGNYLDGWKTGIILYFSHQTARGNNLINCVDDMGDRWDTVHSIGCVDVFKKQSDRASEIIFGNTSDKSMLVPPRPVK